MKGEGSNGRRRGERMNDGDKKEGSEGLETRREGRKMEKQRMKRKKLIQHIYHSIKKDGMKILVV
jgi:hypothetical protein